MLLNDKNYMEYLKGITVVEVSGESCANCLSLMPILHKLVSKIEGVELHHIEASEETVGLLEAFKVEAVPTILIMKDNVVHAKCRGFQPEEILEIWLEAKIEELKK